MKLKTVDIKGKPYVEVKERIKFFREHYKGWSLTSEILQITQDRCIIKASVIDSKNTLIATGIACEIEGTNNINKKSFIENCETSAWGRALGNLGIGLDTSIASFEEVNNAIKDEIKDRKEMDRQDQRKESKWDLDMKTIENLKKSSNPKYVLPKKSS